MNLQQLIDEARQLAAQCWCDEETKDRVMDPALAEAFARRIVFLMVEHNRFARNEEFYRGLLDKCVENLGPLKPKAFICDDGSVSDSPLRIKIPEIVAELAKLVPQSEPPSRAVADWVTCCVCQADLEDEKSQYGRRADWPKWLEAGCCSPDCFDRSEPDGTH